MKKLFFCLSVLFFFCAGAPVLAQKSATASAKIVVTGEVISVILATGQADEPTIDFFNIINRKLATCSGSRMVMPGNLPTGFYLVQASCGGKVIATFRYQKSSPKKA